MNERQNRMLGYTELLSLVLTYENLIENRAQTKANDVNAANDKQAQYMLGRLDQKFEEQNEILRQQNRILTSISDKLDFLISLHFQDS